LQKRSEQLCLDVDRKGPLVKLVDLKQQALATGPRDQFCGQLTIFHAVGALAVA
jgi:hypothetical protein